MNVTEQLKTWVDGSGNIVFFGGMGIPMESGTPDFRSEGGLYRRQYQYPPEAIISHSFYMKDPREFYRFYKDKMIFEDVEPSPAHLTLVRLEKRGKLKAATTRNINDLHQAAGSREVLELYGSIHRSYRIECGKSYGLDVVTKSDGVPKYSYDGMVKPDVVLHEEGLDQETLQKVMYYISHTDMLIIDGISLTVYPAVGLIDYYRGRKLVLINKTMALMDSQMDLAINDKLGEVLGSVVGELWRKGENNGSRRNGSMHKVDETRYETMQYKGRGRGGVLLPKVSLGLWQNFGLEKALDEQKQILFRAFDSGITHFDLANNCGFPASDKTEENFGKILCEELGAYRGEMMISMKAGYDMWSGPYGNWGSRKYLMVSLDQGLKRVGPDCVDISYHHRPGPETPLEETMGALSDIVRRGEALHVEISNYQAGGAERAIYILKENGTPCLIHRSRYNMFERWVEDGPLNVLKKGGVGCIAYNPLAQGVLTDRYLKGIPADFRAARKGTIISGKYPTEEKMEQIQALNRLAEERRQALAQMALVQILRGLEVTSVLAGTSSPEQLSVSVTAIENLEFYAEELTAIEMILGNH